MAEKITRFLHYGASPELVESVSPLIADDFAPSLILHATDDPSIAPSLLYPLVANPRTPKTMSYASLDFDKVRQSVLAEKKQAAENAQFAEPGQETEYSNEDAWEKDWGLLTRHYSEDECLAFETADEINRAKLAITSLHKCASEFFWMIDSGTNAESWWIQQCKAEGSIWSNEAFISDLLSMLPIAVSRCPDLLEPEILVKGLITAKCGGALLAAILINNPLLQQRSVILLADFLSKYLSKTGIDPFYAHVSSFTNNTTPHQASNDASKSKLNPAVSHCVHQACWVLVLLCRSVPQLAFTCREALVKKRTFADMVMHITLELLHDELEFFSRVIFSDKETSEWFLTSLGQKKPPSFLPSLTQTTNHSKQLKEFSGATLVPYPVKDMEGTVQCIRRALLVDADAVFHEQGWRGRLHGHLRLYCVLICAADLQPNHEEVNFWLHALGGKTVTLNQVTISQPQKVVERTLQLGIAFLCLVAGRMSSSAKSLFDACILFLLGSVVSQLESSNPGTEVTVWLVVQLLLRHYPNIAMFVREAVGMDVAIHNSSLEDLCDTVAATGVISEPALVVKATAALRPLHQINSTKKNADLLLRCLCQVMLSGNYIRYAVDISEVVMHCISLSAEPINPILVQLVQMFAEATSTCHKGEVSTQEFRMKPLPCKFLAASLECVSLCHRSLREERRRYSSACYDDFCETKYASCNEEAELMASAALSTFYILCREQVLQSAGIYVGYVYGNSASMHLEDSEDIQWSELLVALPLHNLLMYMEDHWLQYEHLLPQWLSLASHLFPERLLVSKLLEHSEESDKRTDLSKNDIPVVEDFNWVGGYEMIFSSLDTNEENKTYTYGSKFCFSVEIVCKIFRNALVQPLPALQIMKAIQVEAAENKFDVQSVVMNDLVPLLLEDSCARPLQRLFCDWWQTLPHEESELLVPLLFNSIKVTDMDKNNSFKKQNLKESLVKLDLSKSITSYAELAQEPLALLACKNQVYRTPLLSIFLDLLMELLVKNRRICLAGVSQRRNGGLKQEEIMGALAAQESAVCQILLEACLQNPLLGDDVQPGPMLEARQLICAFISSLLNTTPILLKLLHFQGYDIQLVPMMMEGVLAMVQCFEFVQELLRKAQQSEHIFVVVLIANLVRTYPSYSQSLEAAKQVVEHVKYLRRQASSTAVILKEALEPVVWCAISFPSLAFEVTALLQSCLKAACPLEQSGSTSDNALHDAALAAFKLLIQQKVLPGRGFS